MSASAVRRSKAPTEADCVIDPLCCAPLSGAALDRADAGRLAQVLKALADPARLQIISLIRVAPGGEVCVADLVRELGLSQPTVSHHLRVLFDAGVLHRERRGSWVWYAVASDRIDEIRTLLG
ncbi:ArsR/SmtB family transcription factor [Pseudonocardia nigra]|uniref:ArsR/SmtB family transcription factor n=1 Tax=Pseudonocardia nigra TaxID=1921578 RepID=UPI001C5E638D|nr:metalloregulator ArsR/SmtB family transcription factor [Pseudonocardia nigra]